MLRDNPLELRRLIRIGVVAEGASSDVKHFFPDSAFSYAGIILEVHPRVHDTSEYKKYLRLYRARDLVLAEKEAIRYANMLKSEEAKRIKSLQKKASI